jgi:hypothetical protein
MRSFIRAASAAVLSLCFSTGTAQAAISVAIDVPEGFHRTDDAEGTIHYDTDGGEISWTISKPVTVAPNTVESWFASLPRAAPGEMKTESGKTEHLLADNTDAELFYQISNLLTPHGLVCEMLIAIHQGNRAVVERVRTRIDLEPSRIDAVRQAAVGIRLQELPTEEKFDQMPAYVEGSVQYTQPRGWHRTDGAHSSMYICPRAQSHMCVLTIGPANDLDDELRSWMDHQRSPIGMGVINESSDITLSTDENGEWASVFQKITLKTGQVLYQQYETLRSGNHVVMLTLMSTSKEDVLRNVYVFKLLRHNVRIK